MSGIKILGYITMKVLHIINRRYYLFDYVVKIEMTKGNLHFELYSTILKRKDS